MGLASASLMIGVVFLFMFHFSLLLFFSFLFLCCCVRFSIGAVGLFNGGPVALGGCTNTTHGGDPDLVVQCFLFWWPRTCSFAVVGVLEV